MKKGVFLLCILSLLIKLPFLDRYGIAGDEKYSLLVAHYFAQEGANLKESIRKPSEVFTNLEFWNEKKSFKDFQEAIARRENGSGASYFIPLHYVVELFGNGDGVLRLLSAFFVTLLIPLSFYLCKLFFPEKEKVAFVTAVIVALAPFSFNYSFVARNYAFTYFWFGLATYMLLKIIIEEKTKPLWYTVYGLSLILTIFGHHSSYIIYLFHIVIFLLHFQKNKLFKLLFSGLPSVLLFLVWLRSEGGKYGMEAVQNSKVQYLELAANNQMEYSTLKVVFKHFLNTFSGIFPPISGQFYDIESLKLRVLIMVWAVLLFGVRNFLNEKYKTIYPLIFLLLTVIPFYFGIAVGLTSIGMYFFIEVVAYLLRNFDKKLLILYSLAFLPLLFLIFYAFSDGVPMRLNPRYAGFGFVFICIIVAQVGYYLYEKNDRIVNSIVVLLMILLFIKEDYRVIKDNSPNYFHITPPDRLKNPYRAAAENIVEFYAPGDTVIHCTQRLSELAGNVKVPEFSVQDAQYINIYLPKEGIPIVQTFSHSETDKVFLKKKNGKSKLIYDFEGSKYRY
jgi:hypothetical protein